MFVLISPAFSQDVTDWKILTNMESVKDLSVTGDGVWGATTGGVFFNNFQDNSYETFTRSESLTGISFTAIAADKYGKIWIGSSTGGIDVYNPADKSVKSILDIYNSGYTSRQINEIVPQGDTIIVSTDFGISLIDANNFLFLDTFFKLGSFTSNLKVNSTIKNGLFYTCTDSGVAIQKEGSENLSSPDSWISYSKADGLPSYIVNKIAFYNDKLIAATDKGLSVFSDGKWSTFIDGFSSDVLDILPSGETLYILADKTVYSYTNGILTSLYQSSSTLNRIILSSASNIYAAGEDGIKKINIDGTASTILPNGPGANQSWGLAVDGSGTLWVGTGDDDAGVGFYKYSDNLWTNYNTANTPALPTNGYFSAFCSDDGNTYLGNWGTGFVKIKDSVLSVFLPANTGMTGIPDNTNFLVVSGFANDSKGNLWILNYWPGDRKPLTMLSTDSTWYNFYSSAESTPYEQHYNLVIDPYDTKWYCIKDPDKSGLFFFNENKTNTTTSDDRAGYLSTTNGLNSNTINSIVVDRRGEIWVGTPSGANVISNTSTIPAYSSASLKISTVYALRQQSINCIAVDPLNQKWVATNQGLLLVNSDGSSLLASYTTENSPLMTDVVKSVTVDPNSGIVYAGTELGMIKFQTLGIMPQDSFTELFVYPSPFLLKSSGNVLTIDGLIRDTDIKILSTSGKLINEFSSPGGYRATWNGTDMDGKLVSSGVYFIIAYDKEGNNVTTAKVAVLR